MCAATTTRKALILGITGGIGRATAVALDRRGHDIVALVRDRESAARRLAWTGRPITWLSGDAIDAELVARAATGVQVIVHAVNPPAYRNWRGLAVPMLANSIEAAAVSGARIVFPGNIYVYSPASGALVDETTPHAPATRKGAVRRDMEAMLAMAARDRGVRSLIVRAGDFFGPGVDGSYVTHALAKGGRKATRIQDPGTPGVGHAWAYVPDLAETIARLLDRPDRLATADVVHVAGHWIDPGERMAQAVQAALRPRQIPIRRFPWLMIRAGAPFVPFFREMLEMRWLWQHPLRLDNRKLVGLIGPEPHTDLAVAINATLDAAG